MEEKLPQHVRIGSETYTKDLTPNQILVYAGLKMYMNKDTYEAYPSQDTLRKDTGLSKPTIKSCLDKLEKLGEISKFRKGRGYMYKFNPLSEHFEMYSFDFLKDQDLTSEQRAFLVVAQRHMFKDVERIGKISLTDEELSNKIHLSEDTISRRNLELRNKGILTNVPTKDSEGNEVWLKIYDLGKFHQEFVTLKSQVKENTEDITELKKENNALKEENKQIKKVLNVFLNKEENKHLKEKYEFKM